MGWYIIAMSILFRDRREKSLFRRTLLELARSEEKGDTLVILVGSSHILILINKKVAQQLEQLLK